MKLLILSGTPKTDGLCHSLVVAASEAAKAGGAEVKVLSLSSISACRMCGDGWGICRSKHICEFGAEDGFNDFQEDIGWADGFIFITPVYWGEVSEGMKSFLDKLRRCQATKRFENDKEKSFLYVKSSILVASAGGGGGGISSVMVQMERAVTHMGGTGYPYDAQWGFYDYIAVNRWNQDYKRDALRTAVSSLIDWFTNKTTKI
jgi:multimeric flavodoxin WrbA